MGHIIGPGRGRDKESPSLLGSTYCKAHIAAGMCHHTQPKLEVSLGFVPRNIM